MYYSCDDVDNTCEIRQQTDGGATLGSTLNAVIRHHCNI